MLYYTNFYFLIQVLQYLNESVNCYLTSNSVDKCFKQLNESYIEKLDNLVIDLEKELVNKLKKSYPKYSSSIHQHSLNSNQSSFQQYVKKNIYIYKFLFYI